MISIYPFCTCLRDTPRINDDPDHKKQIREVSWSGGGGGEDYDSPGDCGSEVYDDDYDDHDDKDVDDITEGWESHESDEGECSGCCEEGKTR